MMEQFSGWTLGFFVVITALTLYFHFFRYHIRITETGPAILTSIGIFGTFLGVAIGLWGFDATDIQGSVPKLMDGLRTAFWSSIAGLLGALTLKIRAVFSQTKNTPKGNTQRASIDDLDHSLKELTKILQQPAEQNLQQQLKYQNQLLVESMQQVNKTLEDYQERQAEANAKALVGAIEMVMREFNTKINEQYGDNFKRLNQSVIAMLEWQQNYKDQLNTLINEQERTATNMQEAGKAFEFMVQHANAFNGISESLQELLSGIETQRNNLQAQLGSLADLVNHAADGLPKLEERIVALTSGMADSVTKQQNWLQTELSNIQRGSSQIMQEQQQQTMTQLQRLGERVERQVTVLDESMEEELNKALKTFGMQLTALSEKFVSDYSPLTEKLQRLVSMAEQVDE